MTGVRGMCWRNLCAPMLAPIVLAAVVLAAMAGVPAAAQTRVTASVAPHYASGSTALDDQRHLVGGTLFIDASQRWGDFSLVLQSQLQSPDVDDDPDLLSRHALRQFHLDWRGDRMDVRIGRQLLIWGRADRFNPTDTLTPTDFRFLTTDFNGQRYGATGLSARYFLNAEWSVQAVALPEFSPTRLPEGLLPEGVEPPRRIGPPVGFDEPQVGVKFERIGLGFDFSFSGYRGYSVLPAVTLADQELVQVHPRFWMLGADFAATVDQWGFRGEFAWIDYRDANRYANRNGNGDRYSTSFRPGDPFPFGGDVGPRDTLAAVIGVERALDGGDSVLVQLLSQHLPDGRTVAPPPLGLLDAGNRAVFGQFGRTRLGASVTVLGQRLNDQLRFELAGAVHFDRGDWALRPKLEWAIDDRWTLGMVAEWFGGPRDSRFGVLEDGSRVFVQLVRAIPLPGQD